MKINLNIVKDVTYKCAKFYYEILYIVGYTKITNLIKFVDLKINVLRSRRLSFLCRPKYKTFEHDLLHACGINSWLYPDFVFRFFEIQKYNF
jgi:hypothetical protein